MACAPPRACNGCFVRAPLQLGPRRTKEPGATILAYKLRWLSTSRFLSTIVISNRSRVVSPLFLSPSYTRSIASLVLQRPALCPLMKTSSKDNQPTTSTKIPRPVNSFMVFRKAHRQDIASMIDNSQEKNISKAVAEIWNNMSEEEKAPYRDTANNEKNEHRRRYPDYKYRPRQSSAKSSARTNEAAPGLDKRLADQIFGRQLAAAGLSSSSSGSASSSSSSDAQNSLGFNMSSSVALSHCANAAAESSMKDYRVAQAEYEMYIDIVMGKICEVLGKANRLVDFHEMLLMNRENTIQNIRAGRPPWTGSISVLTPEESVKQLAVLHNVRDNRERIKQQARIEEARLLRVAPALRAHVQARGLKNQTQMQTGASTQTQTQAQTQTQTQKGESAQTKVRLSVSEQARIQMEALLRTQAAAKPATAPAPTQAAAPANGWDGDCAPLDAGFADFMASQAALLRGPQQSPVQQQQSFPSSFDAIPSFSQPQAPVQAQPQRTSQVPPTRPQSRASEPSLFTPELPILSNIPGWNSDSEVKGEVPCPTSLLDELYGQAHQGIGSSLGTIDGAFYDGNNALGLGSSSGSGNSADAGSSSAGSSANANASPSGQVTTRSLSVVDVTPPSQTSSASASAFASASSSSSNPSSTSASTSSSCENSASTTPFDTFTTDSLWSEELSFDSFDAQQWFNF
ncbi:hypothetical protein C8Q77DRAFT_192613 [Trametes polyzona]|nr:hypothetical protein C8Q77DRAFT_192613 [Trametes polyzona]